MRALLDMTDHADPLGRHAQTGHHRRFLVAHGLLIGILTARPVAGLALHAILNVESLVALPRLGVGRRRMAAQADR